MSENSCAASDMATKADTPFRERVDDPLSPRNSLDSPDDNFDTFVDIDIKQEPDGPGIEIFDETKEPRQDYDASTSSTSNNNFSGEIPPVNGGNISASKPKKKLTAKKQDSVVDDVLRLALTELRRTSVAANQQEEEEDVCMVFGQMVASELRLMKPVQRIIAKKLINEAIFYGSIGSLQPSSAVMVNLNSIEFDGG